MCGRNLKTLTPDPHHFMCVVALKLETRVIAWTFDDPVIMKPSATENNTLAVISDGYSFSKMTLFEEASKKIWPVLLYCIL